MCFDRNINGKRDVKFLIGIIAHCTDERNLLTLALKDLILSGKTQPTFSVRKYLISLPV